MHHEITRMAIIISYTVSTSLACSTYFFSFMLFHIHHLRLIVDVAK